MQTLGEKIRYLRTKNKINQDTFAKNIGVSKRTLINYENNDKEPVATTLLKIAKYFNVSIDWLLTGKGEMFISNNEKENSTNSILETVKKEENLEVKGKVVNSEGKLLFRFVTEEDIQEVCSLMEYAPPAIVKQIKKKLLEIKKISES